MPNVRRTTRLYTPLTKERYHGSARRLRIPATMSALVEPGEQLPQVAWIELPIAVHEGEDLAP